MSLLPDKFKILLTRNYVLFIIGVTGLLLSLYKLFQEFNIDMLGGVLASISALVGDYFFSKETAGSGTPYANLESKNRKELFALANLEGSSNIKISNTELIKIIRKNHQIGVTTWTRFKWYSLLVVVILAFTFNIAFPLEKNSAPSYSLAFYEKENETFKIINPDSVDVDVTQEDVDLKRVRLPLRLAIKNNESNPLKILKVVITYPEGYVVKSTANPMIDPASNSFVYEQDFSTLTPTAYFTPLKTIDTLITSADFQVLDKVVCPKDNIPGFLRVFIEKSNGLKKNFFDLKVDIYAEGRPVTKGKITVKIKRPSVSILTDYPESELVAPGEHDRLLFQMGLPGSVILDSWEAARDKDQKSVKYILQQDNEGLYQFIFVENVLRRINADTNGDRVIDYILVDPDLNLGLNTKPAFRLNGDGKTLMYNWKKKDFLPPRREDYPD